MLFFRCTLFSNGKITIQLIILIILCYQLGLSTKLVVTGEAHFTEHHLLVAHFLEYVLEILVEQFVVLVF